jgi:uncharacterized membrane protein HdeD (DUF308 family)
MSQLPFSDRDYRTQLGRDVWFWFLLLGLLLIALGIIAVVVPLAGAAAALFLVAFPLILAGFGNTIHAFYTRSWVGFFMHLGIGLLYTVGGVLLLTEPYMGFAVVAIVFGAYFFVVGAMRILLSFQVRGARAWTYLLLSGIVSLILGIVILATWDEKAKYILAILLGVDLMFSGFAMVMLSLAARTIREEVSGPPK